MKIININEIKKLPEIQVQNLNEGIEIIINKSLDESLLLSDSNFVNVHIVIKENVKVELIQVYDELNNLNNLTIDVEGHLRHVVLLKDSNKLTNINSNTKVSGFGEYQKIIFDFSKSSLSLNNVIDVYAHNKAQLYCASVVDEEYNKTIVNRLNNKDIDSNVFMDNYGIAFGNGKVKINGIGHIVKGASKSKNVQKATMFVMDEYAKAVSEPYLFIDEDDVVASHANSVGQVSEETIYYLESRGIEKSIARKMVVLGYFKKFIDLIEDKSVKEMIDEYMKEVINNV